MQLCAGFISAVCRERLGGSYWRYPSGRPELAVWCLMLELLRRGRRRGGRGWGLGNAFERSVEVYWREVSEVRDSWL